jgi:hypothetical protein
MTSLMLARTKGRVVGDLNPFPGELFSAPPSSRRRVAVAVTLEPGSWKMAIPTGWQSRRSAGVVSGMKLDATSRVVTRRRSDFHDDGGEFLGSVSRP